jgi:hypothetical protein
MQNCKAWPLAFFLPERLIATGSVVAEKSRMRL